MPEFQLNPVAQAAGADVLTLAAAKAHLNVVESDWDDLIAALRDAAVDMVQQYTMKSLVPVVRVWRGQFSTPLRLGTGPVASSPAPAITYLNSAGASVALAGSVFRIGIGDSLIPAAGQSWPGDVDGGAGAVTVTFTAGYAAGMIPPALIAAVKLMLGHLFRNREAVIVGTISGETPLGFTALCDRYRELTV